MKTPSWSIAAVGLIALLSAGILDAQQTPYWPPADSQGGWASLTSANTVPTAAQKNDVLVKAGMNWDRLKSGIDIGMNYGWNNGMVIVRNGWIVQEWGNLGHFGTYSSNKGCTGMAFAKILTDSNRGLLQRQIGLESF